jgi:hypothetical protein
MEKPLSELVTVNAEQDLTPEQLEKDIAEDNERFAREDQELALKNLRTNTIKILCDTIIMYKVTGPPNEKGKYPWPEKVITIEEAEVVCTVTSADQKLTVIALCSDGKQRRFKWRNYYYGHSNPYIQPDADEILEIEEL